MKKEPALVIIKPDGVTKGIVGNIVTKFEQTGLEVVATKIAMTRRELIEEHYKHLLDQPFIDGVIDYVLGKFHKQKKLLAIIYYGDQAIKKCRKVAGDTNPEVAHPKSIRGSYGRITTNGIWENVVHVSSGKKEAEREIKLWFEPDDITTNLYPTKISSGKSVKKRAWK